MDEVNTKKNEKVKDIPPIPIKTYKWEDIRREKKKGHYPYTHLNKQPYNEKIDTAEFKMDTLRPSKSASVLEKSSSGVDIQEVTENKDVNNGKDYLEVSEGIVETADSSNEDNVSQYLDKDEDPPIIIEHVETPGPSKEEEKMDVDREESRAKSEEPKRKRKLSIESSYSRISLSKLGVMKKLREAKEKIKLPKFSFSKSESKLDIPKKPKKDKSNGKEGKKEMTLESYLTSKKYDEPVYIHIPLRPPPGETDEFSYLEFEESKPESSMTSPSANTTSNDHEKSTNDKPQEENEQQQKEGLQFIILTPPSDDETLDANVPDTPASENGKKFFNTTKLKDLKTLAKECVDEITPDMPIEGIFFEDVIQVEYVDEQNRPIGTTERSNVLEITEANLPTLEKQLSQRNLAKELEKEIASSMDSLHKIARKNTLKKLKEEKKSKSNETLRKSSVKPKKTQEAPELSGPPPDIKKPVVEVKEAPAKFTFEKVARSAILKAQENAKEKVAEKPPDSKLEKPEVVISEKKETPKPSEKEITTPKDETPRPADTTKSPMYDEEDGLKLSETAVQMINEELAKEQLSKTDGEQLRIAAKNGSIKKKVSFKRRSKQEDPHGVYEDVRVTSDNKKVDGKEQQTKELKMMDQSQSMSVDEEKAYLDDKIIKTTSLEEDYHKWSKSTDHEYEPVNPPAETETQQLSSPPEGQTADTSVKRSSSKQSKKSATGSIRIPLKDEDDVVRSEDESGDALTVEEMQARIEDKFFNKAEEEHPPINVTPATTSPNNKENVPQESSAKRIQDAFKTQAGKLRTKLKNIKKPNIHMPQRPNLEKFKLQKPNITMPKIPDQMRVNLPSFTLPKKGGGSSTRKRPVKQYSTESNAGDSKKKLFDFSTYPRFFKKKKKPDDVEDDAFSESATVPRVKKSSKGRQTKETEKKKKSPDVIRIPLHSEESMDKEENDLSSHARYETENIDMDDAFLRESQEMRTATALRDAESSRSRWNHGSFRGHDLNDAIPDESNPPKDSQLEVEITEVHDVPDVPEVTEVIEIERPQTSPEPELEPELEPEERHSDMRLVSSFGDVREHGVLEKINSDEYFMQMGNYASKEIQEAFKQPTNPLAKMQADDSFDREFDISDQSIQEVPKRRPIKKPKRKKTPNVSKERIAYEQESEVEDYPEPYSEQPTRPKRRSKHKKHTKDEKPPYQETIFVQEPEFETMRKAASDNILLSDRGVDGHFTGGLYRQEYPQLYENEKMHGIEQPNILVSHPYQREEVHRYNGENLEENEKELPEAPPRKQRSLKSLVSEHDSIIDEINLAREILPPHDVEINKLEHEYIIPTPEEPPVRPTRTRSRTRSHSRTTNQPDEELQTPEIAEMPCVEEPCVQQICDYMGYAVIEKNKYREPPLPPPSRKKRCAKPETKFFTVPRPLKDEVPVRPMRNYSTLVPKSKRSPHSSEEEKENVDLGQYIEIEDEGEHSRLQSGEIVQKMKDRPLPAPPRPPRKTKESDKDAPFKDITHKSNVNDEEGLVKMKLEEAEASVQTEPLPDDVVCEELVEEKGDKIIIPTTSKFHKPITEFENVETVTHAALVVTPIPEDFQEGPIASFSRSTEKIITVHREVDHEEESSDVPKSFKHLANPQTKIIERIIERPVASSPEVEVLRAQKLQVSDLDVDRLTVNELLASKIKVSEIDSDSISVTEINPKSGNLVIGGMELPISFIQEIVEKLRRAESANESQSTTQKPQHDSALGGKTSSEISKEEPSEQPAEIVSEAVENGIAPEEVSSDIKGENTDSPINADDNQQSLSEDQIPSLESEERDVTLKSEELIEENLVVTSPESRAEDISESVSELSPTTLKTTIEYLDDLIAEENIKLDLENKLKQQENKKGLEEAVSYKTDLPSVEEYMHEKFESATVEEIPSLIPDTSEEERLIEELKTTPADQKKTPIEELDTPPKRPPRHSDIQRLQQSQEDIFIPSQIIENSHNVFLGDSTLPPRPPDPEERLYLRSQPPPSFFVLRSPVLDDFVDEDIPMPPRRKRPPRPPSGSSSEEELPATPRTRRHRTPEPSIPLLAGQLTRACASASERAFRRLIKHITVNVLRNADGKQDLHVMILILLILIAGLILLGNGGNPVVHHYHWEYFNPPKDL